MVTFLKLLCFRIRIGSVGETAIICFGEFYSMLSNEIPSWLFFLCLL